MTRPGAVGKRWGEMSHKASIAVVTYNTKHYWAKLRRALDAQTESAFELIVIDNASDPDKRLSAEHMPQYARYVQLEENIGFAAANNIAARQTAAPFFVCLNPDAFPRPEWLSRLLSVFDQRPDIAAAGSLQLCDEDPGLIDGAGDCYWAGGLPYRSLRGRPLPRQFHPGEVFSACAAACAFRRSAFDAVGGFDESFFCYCEDVDLGFRLRLAGWKIVQANDAIVHHVGGGSSATQSDFARYYGARNRIWTFVKNMPAPLLCALLPAHILLTAFVLLWSLIRGTPSPTWRGVIAAWKGIGKVVRARAAVQGQRRASTLDIARHMAWSPIAVMQRRSIRRSAERSLPFG